eukprot:2806804-Prymnesium_polylepis.1
MGSCSASLRAVGRAARRSLRRRRRRRRRHLRRPPPRPADSVEVALYECAGTASALPLSSAATSVSSAANASWNHAQPGSLISNATDSSSRNVSAPSRYPNHEPFVGAYQRA